MTKLRSLAPPATAVLLALSTAPLAAQQALLQAPLPVESIEQRMAGSDGARTVLVVGLGRAPDSESPDVGTPIPAGDDLEWVTVLGTEGWTHASRSSVEKRCEYLCGADGPEECHWVGLYALADDGATGATVAVLPGRLDLTDFEQVGRDPGEPNPVASLDVGRPPTVLLWEPTPDWRPTYAIDDWDPDAGRLGLAVVEPGGQPASAIYDDCRTTPREWLLSIDCGEVSILASGGKPLLVSHADYNTAKAEPLARFDYAGSRHYVVRLGTKAQDLIGLVSGEPSGWRARFRLRDWAQLC